MNNNSDIIRVYIKKEKTTIEEKPDSDNKGYVVSSLEVHQAIIIFDFQCHISHRLYICDVVSQLRKTALDEQLWCAKDSLIFHNYKCQFNTLNYINNCKCVILFLTDYSSLQNPKFINYLYAIKSKMEYKTDNFKLISIVESRLKVDIKIQWLEEKMQDFIYHQVIEKGVCVDLSVDLVESSLFTVANILPIIVTHLYTPHQLANVDLQDFYHGRNSSDFYKHKPMYLWTSCELADWLHTKNYSNNIIEAVEMKSINGWIIQNVTPEELANVLPCFTASIRHKMIYDVYQFLCDEDVERKDWQIVARKTKVNSKEVCIIGDPGDSSDIDKFVSSVQSHCKHRLVIHSPSTGDKLKLFAPFIARSKTSVVFITKNALTNNLNGFKRIIEKKILFALWIDRPVIFVLWDCGLSMRDSAFKIMIDNQQVIDFRSNTSAYNSKLLIQLMETITPRSKYRQQVGSNKFMMDTSHFPTVSHLDDYKDFSQIESQIKKKLVLHYHTECQNKVKLIKNVLEDNNFIVDLLVVDRVGVNNLDLEFDRNLREEVILNADIVLTCLSTNYIRSNATKRDLKLICQIFRKKVVAVLVHHIGDMKLLHQIQSSLRFSLKCNLNKQFKAPKTIPTVDLSEAHLSQSIHFSTLVKEIRSFE